jgi:hypothetical protein
VPPPDFENFREIFKRACIQRNITYDEQAVRYLLQEYYVKADRKLRANHPRDLLDQIMDICGYEGTDPLLNKEMLDRAAESYFVDL